MHTSASISCFHCKLSTLQCKEPMLILGNNVIKFHWWIIGFILTSSEYLCRIFEALLEPFRLVNFNIVHHEFQGFFFCLLFFVVLFIYLFNFYNSALSFLLPQEHWRSWVFPQTPFLFLKSGKINHLNCTKLVPTLLAATTILSARL